MKIWLTGSAGMLARAIQQQLLADGVEFVGTDREIDICDKAIVHDFVRDGGFSHIINCAAYTQVDEAETHAEPAYRVNAIGPGNLATAAANAGASLLHFSTDYVFDGKSDVPYTEDARCAPTGAYGQSKLAGEQLVLATLPSGNVIDRHVHIVRTSWLFGEGGGNFVATMLKLLKERDELRVVRDQVGRPTYTVDLAAAALLIAGTLPGETPRENGLYHFANSGATTWWGFANEILAEGRRQGFDVKTKNIIPVSTLEFPRPAPRPAYSVLDTSRFEAAAGYAPRPWPLVLADYLRNLKRAATGKAER